MKARGVEIDPLVSDTMDTKDQNHSIAQYISKMKQNHGLSSLANNQPFEKYPEMFMNYKTDRLHYLCLIQWIRN